MTVLSDAILALEEVVHILRSISPTIEQGEANASPPPAALPASTSQPAGPQNGLTEHPQQGCASFMSNGAPTTSQADPRDGWCDQLRRRDLPDNLYRHLCKAADVSPGEYLTEAHIRAMSLPLAQMAARTCPKRWKRGFDEPRGRYE